jgi:CDP-glucose 4,6-dehydratase
MIDQNFWKGKRVFLTGHTGFKGSWLSLWLASLGVIVRGYSLNPPTDPSLFEEMDIADLVDSKIGDIRDTKKLKESMLNFNPDIIIHMAAQPLVRYSYESPVETYEVNVMGTVYVLEAALSCTNLKAIVNITSDKCYENEESDRGYKEEDPMGGHDPYSSSKGCAELVTSAYRRSFLKAQGIGLASVRAGNVIGGGDWANDRLIPDILRSFEKNIPVIIRNPKSTRPWQHVLEPLSGYIILAQKLYNDPHSFSHGWNFGPYDDDVRPVSWILNKMIEKWGDAKWNLDKDTQPHEAGYLKLDISKVKERLNWTPTWKLEQTLDLIIDWHKHYLNETNMRDVSLNQIMLYQKELSK